MCVWQDNFLRGDGNRRSLQQQRRPRKKTKPPALTKKHKKKRRRGPRRPQKPIPPAVPQGNLLMPSLSLPTHHAHVRCPYFQIHHSLASQMCGCCIPKCHNTSQTPVLCSRLADSDGVNMFSAGANEAWCCVSLTQASAAYTHGLFDV